jgi:signal transduction histidine kinase
VSKTTTFGSGVGLPGRVWASGQPHWVADVVKDPNFPRATTAARCGLHGAFAFPILCGENVYGIMEFFHRKIQEPDESLLAITAAVGSQLGQFVARKRAEEALRRSEAQLTQSQKMEAFGQLAGGVAHDFNNLLTIISGYSDMVLRGLRPDDAAHDLLKEIYKAGERGASLTRQLLSFSRKQVLELKVVDPNVIVRDTEKMLRRLIGEDVRLECVLDPNLGHVKVDRGQIEQVIVNLAVNARDAMPQGGQLTITTGKVDLDEVYAEGHPEVWAGHYVMLSVEDTGTGMDERIRPHIFEPFFTTKEVGKGTGLGLAVVHGIIKQSGGHITVTSEPGRGTTFKLYLPQVEKLRSTGKSHPEIGKGPKGSETILLAEDDEAVRRLARRALEASGYRVLESAHGGEAVRVAEQHLGPIHLLVSDVIMPEMGGRILAERLTASRPGIKVLFMSGYTDDAVVRYGVLEAEMAFLQKPFTLSALARRVREVLDH